MHEDIKLLSMTAASIGFIHTILGPDHYLPFIVMSNSGKWSNAKTAIITFLCGLGHVLSSIVIGLLGIAIGVAVSKLEILESIRADLAAWALIAFGLLYMIWGIKKVFNKQEHLHNHPGKTQRMTPWILFTIFILGPCEPLIPILMYPASQNNLGGAFLVAGIFSAVTISTMFGAVFALRFGLIAIRLKNTERYMHAIAGATILICGISIKFLGL